MAKPQAQERGHLVREFVAWAGTQMRRPRSLRNTFSFPKTSGSVEYASDGGRRTDDKR